MSFTMLETVVLLRDLPEKGLRAGDLGVVVEVYEPNGYEVEFVAASGRTQALVTLEEESLRGVRDEDLVTVRSSVQSAA